MQDNRSHSWWIFSPIFALSKLCVVTFKFNVLLARHRNDLVEHVVGSAKGALSHVIKPNSDVNDEQLVTAFSMVEAVLNSRPLTCVGSDLCDLEPLMPEMFLGKTQVRAKGSTQVDTHANLDFDRHFRVYTLERVMQRFAKEYVRGLQPRGKWNRKLNEGAIVTVFDASNPKYWPLAIVTKA